MGTEHDSAKAGAAPTTPATPATATPGKTTAVLRIPGIPIPVQMPPAEKKPLDLTVKAPEDITPAVDEFRRALEAGDKTQAEMKWMMLTPQDKRAFGGGSQIDGDLERVLKVLPTMIIHVMGESGVDFTNRGPLIEKILRIGVAGWFDGLHLYGGAILQSFLDYLPAREGLDAAGLKKLHRIMTGTNSLAIARPLFERIYVPLADTTYNAKKVKTTPWKAEQIHRLYDVLSTNLPVAHVRTVKAFHLATEEFDKATGAWETAKKGWWNKKGGFVVLPESSANKKEGEGKGHKMTGGQYAQADPKTKKGKTEGTMEKFEVSAMHEVGHAVGDSLGGHMFARSHAFVGWKTNMDAPTWSKGLWGDDAGKKGGDDAINAIDARTYMANELVGTAKLPKGWSDKAKFQEALIKQYGDQPLTKYWMRRARDSEEKSSLYTFSGTANYGKDGRVYIYSSRGGNELSSYCQVAHEKKVSWYSLSSPHEWWAEQYAHFYGNGKTGAGIDAGTVKKLAELDKRDPEAENATMKPDFDAPAADHDEGDDDDAEAQHRVPFPW